VTQHSTQKLIRYFQG